MVIQRKEYWNKRIVFKDRQLIQVVTGIRRCENRMGALFLFR